MTDSTITTPLLPSGEATSSQQDKNEACPIKNIDLNLEYSEVADEEASFGQKTECRICQESDFVVKMESPCYCKGTIKFAHKKCVQRWCNEKGSTTCEICHQTYQPGYTIRLPPSGPRSQTPTFNISDLIWASFPTGSRLGPMIAPPIHMPVAYRSGCESLAHSKGIFIGQLLMCFTDISLFVTLVMRDHNRGRKIDSDKNMMYFVAIGTLVPIIAVILYNCYKRYGNKLMVSRDHTISSADPISISIDGEESNNNNNAMGTGDTQQLEDVSGSVDQAETEPQLHPFLNLLSCVVLFELFLLYFVGLLFDMVA